MMSILSKIGIIIVPKKIVLIRCWFLLTVTFFMLYRSYPTLQILSGRFPIIYGRIIVTSRTITLSLSVTCVSLFLPRHWLLSGFLQVQVTVHMLSLVWSKRLSISFHMIQKLWLLCIWDLLPNASLISQTKAPNA